jgi:hypothetical protein
VEPLGWAAAAAAGVAGCIYLAKKVRDLVRGVLYIVHAIEVIRHLVQRELEHNHGSSMKDDMHGIAVALGKLQRETEDDRRRLKNALRLAAKHHPEDAWLYLDPDERNHL